MTGKFKIDFRRSNGNLHLKPRGPLDGGSAWALIRAIQSHYDGRGKVFIDTRRLTKILPFGAGILKKRLDSTIVARENLIFKGEKGFEIAPEGRRVLVLLENSACKCGGQCSGCGCGKGKKEDAAAGPTDPDCGKL